MEIKVLKSFVAVATYRNFSKAAEALHTVQPAISRHIASLENELSVDFFFRTSREVTITAAGARLLKDAIKIIGQTEQAKRDVILTSKGIIGSLKIGYLGGAALSFLPQLVCQYAAEKPKIDIDLTEMTASEQIRALEKRTIDIGFSRTLPKEIENKYVSIKIYTDKLVAVVPTAHPLAQHDKISLKMLEDEAFILFKREQAIGLFDTIITQCRLSGLSPVIKKQPQQMQAVLTQVASGLGVSIVPYAIRDLRSEGCSFVTLESSNIELPLIMAHSRYAPAPTTIKFAQFISSKIEHIALAMQ